MRWILLSGIWIYQQMPDTIKRRCIFCESCSRHVARIAREQGSFSAFLAFKMRWRQCRPVKAFLLSDSSMSGNIELADGSVVHEDILVAEAYEPFKRIALMLRDEIANESSLAVFE